MGGSCSFIDVITTMDSDIHSLAINKVSKSAVKKPIFGSYIYLYGVILTMTGIPIGFYTSLLFIRYNIKEGTKC